MIGCQALRPVAHFAALFLRPHLDLQNSLIDIFHGDEPVFAPYCKQSRFIHQVFEIGSGKSGSTFCYGVKIDIITKLLIAGVDFQDCFSAADIRQSDINLAIEGRCLSVCRPRQSHQ